MQQYSRCYSHTIGPVVYVAKTMHLRTKIDKLRRSNLEVHSLGAKELLKWHSVHPTARGPERKHVVLHQPRPARASCSVLMILMLSIQEPGARAATHG